MEDGHRAHQIREANTAHAHSATSRKQIARDRNAALQHLESAIDQLESKRGAFETSRPPSRQHRRRTDRDFVA